MNARATAFATLASAAGACACLAVLGAVRVPLPWYEPLLGNFHIGPHSSVAMDWYARCAASLLVGALLFFAARGWASRKPVTPNAFRLVLGWALLGFTLVVGFYGWTLNGRRALPEPLPSGYQPK